MSTHALDDVQVRPHSTMPLVVLGVLAASVCAVASAVVGIADAPNLVAVSVLMLFALATERIDVNLGPLSFTGGFLPAVATCVISPQLAPLLGLVAVVGPYPSVRSRATNAAISVVACWAGAFLATLVGAPSSSVGTTVAAGGLATLGFLVTNSVLVGTYVWAVTREPARDLARDLTAAFAATAVFFAPIVGGFCAAVIAFGWWIIPMLLVPLALCQYFLSLYARKVELTSQLAEKAQILARTNLQFAAAMVKALDARDAYTAGHSAAVAVYTRDIAREMGFDDETVRLAHLAGLLHDIGKIGVPGRVLNKTAPLDDEEYELMKSHAAMGAEILSEVDLYSDIAILVRYHHERIDGKGYPDGIAGDAIPAISRMISVADTYSAMTTDRPYRDGMPTEKAMNILRECRGTQLDREFTDAFLRILVTADAEYQRGKQTEFEVEVAKHQALSEVEAEAIRVAAPHEEAPTPVVPAIAPDGDVIEVDLEREAA